ncbi:GSU2403 family nucleotidyltransferase fold protein [Mesorhizobium sp. RMAD-H1]|uniref:GSU2403 family nucleotidyltransferase fold protein n=1 Tax=Mesorhizobium sp. RMAD-H1 TaxID=2587065 RepID=UPI001792367C|nr:GSU2403 family nucleotidyltransferase fold protein [Mesorhizobium sp. RMAD-H1]MBB2970024.1 hypothetical protein [Mesorhizobium sp. RMAD-H1]
MIVTDKNSFSVCNFYARLQTENKILSVTEMKQLSPTIQTLYQELVQQVHNVTERTGSLYTRSVKNIDYIYVKRTVGSARRDVFIGRADAPEAQSRAEQIRQEATRSRERRKIVNTLKTAGVPVPTHALGVVLDALEDAGLLREAVVVGTAAYQCYSPIVGLPLPSASLMTQDADLATASLALSGEDITETMETILQRADSTFKPIPGLNPKALPSSFRAANGFVVDLLTPQLRRDDTNPMPLQNLQAGAVPLQHLRWLIADPIPACALYGSGIALYVPAPARFAIHKLIIAQKRTGDRSKRTKDLLQAKALIEALQASDPWALADAYEDACAQGSGWQQPISRSLQELAIDAAAFASGGN